MHSHRAILKKAEKFNYNKLRTTKDSKLANSSEMMNLYPQRTNFVINRKKKIETLLLR